MIKQKHHLTILTSTVSWAETETVSTSINQFFFQTRQLNVGECLPSSCAIADVRLLMIQERSQGATINIVGIKAVPGDYNMWQDYKFHIIG